LNKEEKGRKSKRQKGRTKEETVNQAKQEGSHSKGNKQTNRQRYIIEKSEIRKETNRTGVKVTIGGRLKEDLNKTKEDNEKQTVEGSYCCRISVKILGKSKASSTRISDYWDLIRNQGLENTKQES
jgi:hypothetical protein